MYLTKSAYISHVCTINMNLVVKSWDIIQSCFVSFQTVSYSIFPLSSSRMPCALRDAELYSIKQNTGPENIRDIRSLNPPVQMHEKSGC
jgi:hypothetical protein